MARINEELTIQENINYQKEVLKVLKDEKKIVEFKEEFLKEYLAEKKSYGFYLSVYADNEGFSIGLFTVENTYPMSVWEGYGVDILSLSCNSTMDGFEYSMEFLQECLEEKKLWGKLRDNLQDDIEEFIKEGKTIQEIIENFYELDLNEYTIKESMIDIISKDNEDLLEDEIEENLKYNFNEYIWTSFELKLDITIKTLERQIKELENELESEV